MQVSQLQSLESRIALSAALQTALADIPASHARGVSSFVADIQLSPAKDATAQARLPNSTQQLVVDTAAATLPRALAEPASDPMGIDPGSGSMTTLGDGNTDFQALGVVDQTDSSPEPPPQESDGGAGTPPQGPSQPDLQPTPDPTARIAQISIAEDKFDPGLLDPLAWTDSEDQFSDAFTGATDALDSVDFSLGLSLLGLSPQQELAVAVGIRSYPDLLAAGARGSFSFESSILSQKDLESIHDTQGVDTQNESIIAGTMPFGSLLSGLNLTQQTAPDAHQRFAELGPLEQSSPLALVATLWTVPSLTPFSADPRNRTGERVHRQPETATPLASWDVYVMGLDHAFERTYRDICQGLTAGAPITPQSESSHRTPEGGSEWRMPLVPMASSESRRAYPEASQIDGRSQSDQMILAPEAIFLGPSAAPGELGSAVHSECDLERGGAAEPAIRASVPVVTVITGSVLIAGWFWARSASRPRHRGGRFSPPEHSRASPVLP
jgi:hypothetical protein